MWPNNVYNFPYTGLTQTPSKARFIDILILNRLKVKRPMHLCTIPGATARLYVFYTDTKKVRQIYGAVCSEVSPVLGLQLLGTMTWGMEFPKYIVGV